MPAEPILVAGAGSWGTALAIVLARNGGPVRLWGRDPGLLQEIAADGRNQRYLPGIDLPANIEAMAALDAAMADVGDVVIVVPCQALRETARQLVDVAARPLRIAWACKGFEQATAKLPHEVLSEVVSPHSPMAVLSGPTFAREVAKGLPAAITVGTNDKTFAAALVNYFHSASFRLYVSEDLIGVQVGGALKNVIAIAAGITDGLGLGANSRAAIITRGLAEIARFGTALGGRMETFMGLSGMGDLVLSCADDQSRNRQLGLALAAGESLSRAISRIGPVVEGVHTAQIVMTLADSYDVELPICQAVAQILAGDSSPEQAVERLMTRDPARETGASS